MIPTCGQEAVALSIPGKLVAVFAPVDGRFWHPRCSAGDDHWGQSCHNYFSGFIRYGRRNCGETVSNMNK